MNASRASGMALALVAWIAPVAGGESRAATYVAGRQLQVAGSAYEEALQAFGAALARLRSGDDEAREALLDAARALCEAHGRCDARDVAAHYAGLSRAERVRGWKAERELARLRELVFDAGVAGVRGAAWAQERERLLRELERLVESEAPAGDFTPAAGALSLWAVLVTEQAERAPAEDGAAHGGLAPERTELARANAQRALELFQRAGQRTPCLEPLWLLGRLALLDSDHARALEWFARCDAEARALRRDDYRELALQGQVRLARLEGDVRAEERLLAELASFRSPAQSWPVARDWGARLLSADFGAQAAEFLERHAPPEGSHVADRDEWNLLLGSARLRTGDTHAAREHFEYVARTCGGELALLALASLALHEGEELEAIELLAQADGFSALGRARADALLGEAYARANELQLAERHLRRVGDAAREWETRSSSARSLALEAPLARAAGSVVGERMGLHSVALLADVLARAGHGLEAVRAVEDWQSRSLRRGAEELTSEAIREWASAFELGLVTWVVGADFTFVAHVAPDGRVSHARVPRGRRELEDAVRRLRELALASAMDTPRSDDDAPWGVRAAERPSGLRGAADARWTLRSRAFLDEIAPPPIAASLREAARQNAAPAPRLLVCLHGPLEAAPLEALDWDALCGAGDLALTALAGLPSVTFGARPAAQDLESWFLLGGPLDHEGHELLPGAREELAAAFETRPASSLSIGAAFQRSALLDAARSGAALHLATHLVLDADSAPDGAHGASFVVSPGERVTLDELAQAAPRLPLAVLSACWSGGGEFVDAEGLFGMARVFLAGGSRNVVVTLWPVEDAAAAQFGAAFHRALLAQGAAPSPARACAFARRELARQGFDRASWSAFRALGRD